MTALPGTTRTRPVRTYAATRRLTRTAASDDALVRALVEDARRCVARMMRLHAVEPVGVVDVHLGYDHAEAWTQNLAVLFVEARGVDETWRLARSLRRRFAFGFWRGMHR